MVKISDQSEHFSVLVLKGLKILSVIVNFVFLNQFLDIWIRNPDPDSEYGSGSETLLKMSLGLQWVVDTIDES